MGRGKREVLRVQAGPGDIKRSYGRLSGIYTIIESTFEKRLRRKGLELLAIVPGEVVLEIGTGTGYTLREIAGSVGSEGKAYGIDITPEMISITRKRLERAGLIDRVELDEGDARSMPYQDAKFDAVYMAATLELFDTPDIPRVLGEIGRILNPGGRLGVVSLEREGREGSVFVKCYEWLHNVFPGYASCRPIYVEEAIKQAGYEVVKSEEVQLYGIAPFRIILAKPKAGQYAKTEN